MTVPKGGHKLLEPANVCPQKEAFFASVVTLSKVGFYVAELANALDVCQHFRLLKVYCSLFITVASSTQTNTDK